MIKNILQGGRHQQVQRSWGRAEPYKVEGKRKAWVPRHSDGESGVYPQRWVGQVLYDIISLGKGAQILSINGSHWSILIHTYTLRRLPCENWRVTKKQHKQNWQVKMTERKHGRGTFRGSYRGKVELLVAQMRVKSVGLERLGVHFRLRACRACSQIGWGEWRKQRRQYREYGRNIPGEKLRFQCLLR